MKPRHLLVIGFALVAVTLVALVALATRAKYPPRKHRLPDGSFLKIVSISYGTNHTFALPQHKPWKTFLVTHLPRSWTARLGWWANGASVDLSPRPGEASLAIFTICELARPTSFSSSPKVVLSDERATSYDSAFEGAVAGGFDGKHNWKLVGWQLSKVPRDSKWLSLRFSEQSADGRTRQQVAEFVIPNPLAKAGTNEAAHKTSAQQERSTE
jgi:hypothetical protein